MNNIDHNPWEAQPEGLRENVQKVVAKKNILDINPLRILSVWPWMIVCALVGLGLGYLYLRYSVNVYKVSTSINIKQDQEVSLGQALFASTRDPFYDQIAFIKSPVLASKMIDSLKLRYQAVAKGRVKDKNMYGVIQWQVLNEADFPDNDRISFTLQPNKEGFTYSVDSIKSRPGNWGVPFSLGPRRIVVYKIREVTASGDIQCFSVGKWPLAFSISSGVNITSTKESNIIEISYTDISSERAVDILNGLVAMYNVILRKEKTLTYEQAINFIEDRLKPLSRELDSIERALAIYKSKRGFVKEDANGPIYLEKSQAYDEKISEVQLQKSIIEAIEAYIKNPNTKAENISLVGINDEYLQTILMQFQKTREERNRMALTATENNPDLKLLDKHLSDLRKNIEVQLSNFKRNLEITEANNKQNYQKAVSMLTGTPSDEKALLEQFRQQNIKQSLFLLLLQKKEEASIAKASVTVNTKELKPALAPGVPVGASRGKVFSIALIIGLLIPLLFTIARELLNRKIISKKQLQQMLTPPIIGELEEAKMEGDEVFAVDLKGRSMIGEQIRSLRTNIGFYIPKKNCTYILITSSMSGEGKSFLSANLARSYSIQGKRVALLEFDMRRPKLAKRFGIKTKEGLSSMLAGKIPVDKIAVPLMESSEHFHFYPAGILPPNPQELMAGEHMQKLKDYLDKNYDVVVLDSPPYGIVADAQILEPWSDITIMVVRFGLTIADQVHEIQDWYEKGHFPRMAIVFNGLRDSGYYGYKYGYYYYKRRYGYSYYAKTEPSEE